MIEADSAPTSIYEVLRMSKAAMTHLLIVRMSSIWPRMAEDILTARPGTYQQDVLHTQLLGYKENPTVLDRVPMSTEGKLSRIQRGCF